MLVRLTPCVCAPIAPYEKTVFSIVDFRSRRWLFEIYVSTPLVVCERCEGFLFTASKNLTKNFTGVDDPYEAPQTPEVMLDTTENSVEKSVNIIVKKIEDLGYTTESL